MMATEVKAENVFNFVILHFCDMKMVGMFSFTTAICFHNYYFLFLFFIVFIIITIENKKGFKKYDFF